VIVVNATASDSPLILSECHAIFHTKLAWFFLPTFSDSSRDVIKRFLHLINQNQAKLTRLQFG
jgi:hypothetical protein